MTFDSDYVYSLYYCWNAIVVEVLFQGTWQDNDEPVDVDACFFPLFFDWDVAYTVSQHHRAVWYIKSVAKWIRLLPN